MSIDERHTAHDQDPEDLPTMTLAEPKAATRDPQGARAGVAMTPAAPSRTQREPASTGAPVEESVIESEHGADGARHREAADSQSGQPTPAGAHRWRWPGRSDARDSSDRGRRRRGRTTTCL